MFTHIGPTPDGRVRIRRWSVWLRTYIFGGRRGSRRENRGDGPPFQTAVRISVEYIIENELNHNRYAVCVGVDGWPFDIWSYDPGYGRVPKRAKTLRAVFLAQVGFPLKGLHEQLGNEWLDSGDPAAVGQIHLD